MLAALALLLFTAFPFAWMASTALKPSREIFVTPPTLWPAHVTLDNVGRLFAETRFLTYFRNSLIVSFATVGLTLLVSVPAAYGLTRFRFRGRETIAGLILFTYMFAPIMIIIPFYVAMRFLGLTNTHLGLILAYTAFCLPFSLWLLRTFFQSIPLEIEEAAMIDGSRLQAVIYVVLPLALPGRDRDRNLHFHPGLERLHFRARAAERRRDENAAGRNRRSLQRERGRLGNDHGRRPSGDRARGGRFRFHSEVPCRGLGLGRSEGLIA